MRILILTNYYPPDLSAGAFRMKALIDAFEISKTMDLEIDLITTMPSRYSTFQGPAEQYEDYGWLRIHRISLPVHNNSMISQVKAYAYYVKGVLQITYGKNWDLIFATSSRLMTAVLGCTVAKIKGKPLYLDIRDLFTKNIDDLFKDHPLIFFSKIFTALEKYSLRYATRVNIVSPGFLNHIKNIRKQEDVRLFTNGIDPVFSEQDFLKTEPSSDFTTILYAGNFGVGQGLTKIIPEVAKALCGRVNFVLIGDGSQKQELRIQLNERNIKNVEILDPVPRHELINFYKQADVLFLHLNDLKVFEEVLPSKVFEYGAIGKPILAGVTGFAKNFMHEHLPDAEVFYPGDADAMLRSFDKLDKNSSLINREVFINNFSREKIMTEMVADLFQVLRVVEKNGGKSNE